MSQRKDGNDFVGRLHLKWLRYTGVRWASYLCAIRCTLACGEHRISDANRCTPDQMILSVGYATGPSSHWSRKRLSPRDSTCSVVRRAFQSNCLLPAVKLEDGNVQWAVATRITYCLHVVFRFRNIDC